MKLGVVQRQIRGVELQRVDGVLRWVALAVRIRFAEWSDKLSYVGKNVDGDNVFGFVTIQLNVELSPFAGSFEKLEALLGGRLF